MLKNKSHCSGRDGKLIYPRSLDVNSSRSPTKDSANSFSGGGFHWQDAMEVDEDNSEADDWEMDEDTFEDDFDEDELQSNTTSSVLRLGNSRYKA
jgi:hypothetical protein